MNIIDLTKYDTILTVGVNNGKLDSFITDIKFWCDENKDSCKNAIFVAMGNAKLGIKEDEFYYNKLSNLNKFLHSKNSLLLFIRGTLDNPEVFNERSLSMSNWMTIPDFSILKLKNKNVLCIGGGLSYDRTWRIFKQDLINQFKDDSHKKIMYWENEAFDKNQQNIIDILSSNLPINGLITHTYVRQFTNNDKMKTYWGETDEVLTNDIENEDLFLNNLFDSLPNIEWWVGSKSKRYDTMLNENGIYLVQMTNQTYVVNAPKDKRALEEQNALMELQKESKRLSKFKPFSMSTYDKDVLSDLRGRINPRRRTDRVEGQVAEDRVYVNEPQEPQVIRWEDLYVNHQNYYPDTQLGEPIEQAEPLEVAHENETDFIDELLGHEENVDNSNEVNNDANGLTAQQTLRTVDLNNIEYNYHTLGTTIAPF